MNGKYNTTYFQLSFEYNPNYHPSPPKGKISLPYINAIIFNFLFITKKVLKKACDWNETPWSEQLM